MVISRSLVSSALDSASRSVIVKGPRSSGKTTAVTQWLRSKADDIPVVWMTLEPTQAVLADFWPRLGELAVDAGIAPSDSVLGRALSDGRRAEVAAEFVGDALLRSGRQWRLVIDNLHCLDDMSQRALARFIERLPSLTFIGLTRRDTQLDSEASALRLNTQVITSRELAFTDDELAELARLEGVTLSSDDIPLIQKLSNGHALASRLALKALAERVPQSTREETRSLMISRITRAIDPMAAFDSTQDGARALKLALAPVLDLDLARALTGDENVEDFLTRLDSEGLGRLHVAGDRTVFRLDPLIRKAMVDRARLRLSAQELRDGYRTAAAHLTAWGDPLDVLGLLINAEDYASVWPHFTQNFSYFTTRHRADAATILSSLPDAVLMAHGTLAVTLAIVLNETTAQPSNRVQQLAAWCVNDLDQRDEPSESFEKALHLAARAAAYRTIRRYSQCADVCDQLIELVDHLLSRPSSEITEFAYPAISQSLIAYILDGRFSRAASTSHGLPIRSDPNPERRAYVTALTAYAHALNGEMPAATAALDLLSSTMHDDWMRSFKGTGHGIAIALRRLEAGDVDGAHAALDTLEYRIGYTEHWVTTFYTRALIHIVAGNAAAGCSEITRAIEGARDRAASKRLSAMLTAALADLTMASGDLRGARRILDHSPQEPSVVLGRSRLALLSHKPQDALDAATSVLNARVTVRETASLWLTAGVASHQLRLSDQARRYASHATSHLRRFQLTSPLALIPRSEFDSLLTERGVDLPAHIGDTFTAPQSELLTPRERVVLELLATNASTNEISEQLFVSPNTVKTQIRSIYRKLGVSRRAGAIAAARSIGLF